MNNYKKWICFYKCYNVEDKMTTGHICFRLPLPWSRQSSHHSGVMWRTGGTMKHQLALLCTLLTWRLVHIYLKLLSLYITLLP